MVVKGWGYTKEPKKAVEIKSSGGRGRGSVTAGFTETTLVFIFYAHTHVLQELKPFRFSHLSLRSGDSFSVLGWVGRLHKLSSLGYKERTFKVESSLETSSL